MNTRPNAFQRWLHGFFMLRPVTAFFAPWIHRFDSAILKLTQGKSSAVEILGWNIIQLRTTGAKTNQPRTVPLIGLFDGQRIALIASSFGRERNPGWYYNLKKNPECEVQYRGCSKAYIARETDGPEREKFWQLALSYYVGYQRYQGRMGRKIPVMLLEPKWHS